MTSNTRLKYQISRGKHKLNESSSKNNVADTQTSNLSEEGVLLLQATGKGDIRTVKRLLGTGIFVDLKYKESCDTPLLLASEAGNYSIARILLEHDADINKQNANGTTPLMAASESGNEKLVRLLASHPRCDVDIQDNTGKTALSLACSGAYKPIVDILLEHNADVDIRDKTANTALLVACIEGNVKIVQRLLEKGSDTTCHNTFGYTALMNASTYGNAQTVKLLLDRGVEINEHNYYGDTAITLAVASSEPSPEIIKMLCQSGAEINNLTNKPLLSQAIEDKNYNLLNLLIKLGANVNEKDTEGYTPLMRASKQLHISAVDFLIGQGASLEDRCSKGETVLDKILSTLTCRKFGLHQALKRNLALKLMRSGARVRSNDSALFLFHKKILKDDRVFVQLMLKNGASTKYSDFHTFSYRTTFTPLMTALRCKDTDTARYFISNWFFDPIDITASPLHPYCRQFIRGPGLGLLDQLHSQPWSLTCLCFVHISSAVGFEEGREERIEQLKLPRIVKDKLMFRGVTAKLPVYRWKSLQISV